MTTPGLNTPPAKPASTVLNGIVTHAIIRRTAKTRPCNSRGVCVCQIACECAFMTGVMPIEARIHGRRQVQQG